MENKLPGVGVVVGRFQVPALHEGHLGIMAKAARHQKMIVMVGMHPELATPTNPLDFHTRQRMIIEHFPTAIVMGIGDMPSNEQWSQNLDKVIYTMCPIFAEAHSVTLYSGRDGFASYYSGSFNVQFFDDVVDESGSAIRDHVGHEVRTSEDFRAGVIYGAYNSRPRLVPTVDIAVTKETPDDYEHVLVGRKKCFPDRYVFPGGFVDLKDESLEAAVLREMREEVGHIEVSPPKFVSSHVVDDWRTKGTPTVKIMTSLFMVEYLYGSVKAGDDLDGLLWIPSKELTTAPFTDSHKPLALALYRRLYGE